MLIDQTVFGEAMKRLRGKITQRQACRRARVPFGTWSEWESGKRQPRRSQLEKILRGLACKEYDLKVEIWKVQTERLQGHELETLAVIDSEYGQLQSETLWQLEFYELPSGARKRMSRMRSRIAVMWENFLTQFEPLIADFEKLAKVLHAELVQQGKERDCARSFDHRVPQGPLSELRAALLADRLHDRAEEQPDEDQSL